MIDRGTRLLRVASASVRRARTAVSALSLIAILIGGLAYLTFGALGVDPTRPGIRVRVPLAESGGLLPNQDVTLRGVPVGRVEAVELDDSGVTAVALIDGRTRIPVDTAVRVSGLSPAGEQYLDFRPQTSGGPFLADGSVIEPGRTEIPVTLAQTLANADGALAQLDPQKLATIRKELGVSPQGPEKLGAIFDGGTFLLSTLDGVLPQTVSLVRNSRISFSTIADVNPGLEATADHLGDVLNGVRGMDGGFRQLVAQGPQTLNAVDTLFQNNSETMVELLGSLTTVARLSYVRVPALNALFPETSVRGSMLENIATIFHDGAIWALADIYPRYTCDYAVPRGVPSAADYPEPQQYTYCDNDDPSVLVRGARNAPRPAGDDTAGPPQDADPAKITDPTPPGPWTVPTPYGGPRWPLPIPGEAAPSPAPDNATTGEAGR